MSIGRRFDQKWTRQQHAKFVVEKTNWRFCVLLSLTSVPMVLSNASASHIMTKAYFRVTAANSAYFLVNVLPGENTLLQLRHTIKGETMHCLMSLIVVLCACVCVCVDSPLPPSSQAVSFNRVRRNSSKKLVTPMAASSCHL